MPRPISTGIGRSGKPHVAALESGTCCWPSCESSVTAVDAPLCWRHLLKATKIALAAHLGDINRALVENRLAEFLEQRPLVVSKVYFIRLGDRIKIGYSTNVEQRLRDLPHEELLHVMPGTIEDERRLHSLFAEDRVAGEWFRISARLLEHIKQLRSAA